MTREQLAALMAWVEISINVHAARHSSGPGLQQMRELQVGIRNSLLDMFPEEQKGHDLQGPILVGQRFIWEPSDSHAWASIRVTRIAKDKIESEVLAGNGAGTKCWNDEDRFREACVRAPDR